MFLFAISFILVWTSTYFITSSLKPKNVLGLVYMPIIAFSQIVLTFEILSLFTAMKAPFVLGMNIAILILSIFIWQKLGRPLWTLDCSEFKTRFFNSLKLDKSLIVLFCGFIFSIFVAVILNFLLPVTNSDAMIYHIARSQFWALQGSLNHYATAEVRSLCLPINSEILYSWVLLFIKKDVFIGFFSLVGYFLAMISTYNILSYIKMSTRRKLWIIFLVSSFASVIVQLSSTETDIIIAGLVASSVFLFWNALKTKEKTPLYISALAYALAIGTKTTALIMIPAVGVLMLALCAHYKNFKNLLLFLGFGIVNFLLFSAYNYVSNIITFGSIMGSENFIVVSKNYYGIKGLLANFVRYIFMFFDFTGFKWNEYVMLDLISLKASVLGFLQLNSIPEGIYTPQNGDFQRTLIEPVMGTGILGFTLLLPCFAVALLRPILNLKSQKARFLFGFSSIFWINIITISFLLAYMLYSVRFVMSFIILSAPVLYFSYFRTKFLRIFKYLIIFFAMFYFTLVSTHLWARPFFRVINYWAKNNYSISMIRNTATCKDFLKYTLYTDSACLLNNKIRTYEPDTKILYLATDDDSTFIIKKLEYEGYKLDIKLLETPQNIDFNSYNLIITTNVGQTSSIIKDYENRKDDFGIKDKKPYIKVPREIPCGYRYNVKAPMFYNNKRVLPYEVVCNIQTKIYPKYNLKKIASLGVLNPSRQDFNYFIILENTKNPAKLK